MTEIPSKRLRVFMQVYWTFWSVVLLLHIFDRTLFVGLLDISTLPKEPRLRAVFESLLISSVLVGIAWVAFAFLLLSEAPRYMPGNREQPKLPKAFFIVIFVLLLALTDQLPAFFGFGSEPHSVYRAFPKTGALALSAFTLVVACLPLCAVVDRAASIEGFKKAALRSQRG